MQSARARQRWIFFSFTLLEESQVYLRRPFFFLLQSGSQSVSNIVLVGSLPKLLVLLNLFLADALALARTVQLPNQPTKVLSLLFTQLCSSVSFFVCCPAPPEITTTTTREPYGSLRITVTTVTPSTPPPLSYIVSQTSWAMNVPDSYGFFFRPLPLMAEIISVFRICIV